MPSQQDDQFLSALEREARGITAVRGMTYASPGELAKALDARTIQTPALDLIDKKLQQVAICVEAMFRRRKVFEALVDSGVDQLEAALQAEI